MCSSEQSVARFPDFRIRGKVPSPKKTDERKRRLDSWMTITKIQRHMCGRQMHVVRTTNPPTGTSSRCGKTRLRHPHPEASQSRVREVAIADGTNLRHPFTKGPYRSPMRAYTPEPALQLVGKSFMWPFRTHWRLCPSDWQPSPIR